MPVKELEYRVVIDDTGAIKTINKVDKKQDTLNKNAKNRSTQQTGFLKKISLGWVAVAAVLTGVVAKGFSAVIKAAINAEETISKFNTVFATVRREADAMAKNLSDNFGLSAIKARELLSDTGDLLSGFGFTGKAALDLSGQVNELAVDLASFTNFSGGAEGASKALTKALLGERESLKTLGIAILDSDVQQRLLEKGQKSLTGTALRQAKAQATLELAMEQSKNAMGDFARTSDSAANQSRVLEGAMNDLKVIIGTQLLPQLKPLIQEFAKFSKSATAMQGAAKAGKALLIIVEFIKIAINNLLAPFKILAIIGQSAFIVIEGSIKRVMKRFEFMSKAIDFVKGGFKKLATGVKDFFDIAEKKIDTQIDKIDGPMQEALANLKKGFKSVAGDSAKQYEKVSKMIQDLITKQEEDFFNSQDNMVDKAEESQDAITNKIKLSKEERKTLDKLTNEEQFMDEQQKLENKIAKLEEFVSFRKLTDEEELAAKNAIFELEEDLQEFKDESLKKESEEKEALAAKELALSEEVKQKKIDDLRAVLAITSDITNRVTGIIDAAHNLRIKQIEAEGGSAEDIQKKKAVAEWKFAVFKKAQSITRSIIDTARAIAQSLPNIPLAAVVGGLGAIQTGVIAGTPIPPKPFRGGGLMAKAGRIRVGEGGEELMDVPGGTRIFNNSESQMMSARGVPISNVSNTSNNNNQRSFNIAHAIFMNDNDYDERTNRRLGLGGDFT